MTAIPDPGQWLTALLTGVAEHLHDVGVVDWVPDAAIEQLTRPLILGPVPPTPDLCMGAVPYSPVDDPDSIDTVQPVQFWIRGDDDPDTVRSWGGELFDALHGLEDVTFGGVPVTLVTRRSAVPMGRDDSGRFEAAHNYAFLAAQPTAHRPD